MIAPVSPDPICVRINDAAHMIGVGRTKLYELIATNGFLTAMYGSVLRFGKVPRFLRVLPIDLPIGMPIGLLRLRNRTLAPSAELFAMVTRGIVRPMHSLSAKQLRREMQANS